MSHGHTPAQPSPLFGQSPAGAAHAAWPPPAPVNGVGLAGFILSLIGLLSCGLLSPIGFILSLVGIFKEPKGFAIAGLVLGLLGSFWVIGVALAVGLTLIAAAGAAMLAGGGLAGVFESAAEAFEIRAAIEQYSRDNAGKQPLTLADLTGLDPQTLVDRWGRPYVYTPGADGRSYTLQSYGKDGQPGTPDDVTFDF